MNRINVFKSEEGKEKIRGYYNKILSFFPLTQRYADTSFGRTFLLEAGSAENPAVILLHGSCSNSAAWLGDIPLLAQHYHVFAADIPGEAGNSDENRLNFDSNEYPDWLNMVLNALETERAAVIGNSMGGWLALHFAAAYPARTAALALLAPSGIIPSKQTFIDKTADFTDTGSAETMIKAVMGDAVIPKEVLEFMTLIAENFSPFTGLLPVLSNEQMSALTMPVLYSAGTNDVTTDTAQAVQRLSRLVPHAKIHLTDGAHVIMNAADFVMPFLTGNFKYEDF